MSRSGREHAEGFHLTIVTAVAEFVPLEMLHLHPAHIVHGHVQPESQTVS